MATVISGATGNFTTAGTWYLADATSELDSETSTTSTTTSAVASSAFTPGAITINAVAVKISSCVASPTGTFTIDLFNSSLSAQVANTVVTVNVSDLPTNGGWVVFPTNGSVLLIVATNYQVRVLSSVNAEVTLFTDATAHNWSRELRSTTTQAPASGDKIIVAGEHTGAGTGNSFTVTMNQTATTSYGAVAFTQSLTVNKRSTLAYGTSASTNYYLKIKGLSKIFDGGTFTIGTSGTPVPSTSTAVYEFDSTANVDSGLTVNPGGTFTTFGNALTFDRTMLAADAASSATSLTTSDSTGWLNGDTIALASTTRTASQSESKALTAGASGTTLTITALTNAHSGTNGGTGADIRAELANLTRNVKIRGISTSLQGFIDCKNTSIVSMSWTEIYQMGSSTALKTGISTATTTGSFIVNRCSIHDFIVGNATGITITGSTSNNITISNNVFYNMALTFINIAVTSNINSITSNLMILAVGGNGCILSDIGLTFTGNTIVSSGNYGIQINESTAATAIFGSFSSNIAHSNASAGLEFSLPATGGTVSSCTFWRNSSSGIDIPVAISSITFDTIALFGNLTNNISIGTTSIISCIFNAITSNAGTTLTTTSGMNIQSATPDCIIQNSSFGATTAHTQDIIVNSGGSNNSIWMNLANTILASSTELTGQTSMLPGSQIGSEKHDQTAGLHKAFKREGTISTDTVIFNSASPSARLTPNSATLKLYTTLGTFPITSGSTLTFTVNVRKSVIGDGTAYNGNQPRLIVKANAAVGINTNTVLATASGAAGSWESLSGTTASATDDGAVQILVDCDGTTGWINVDDATILVPDSTAFKYWFNGQPSISGLFDTSTIYTDPGVSNVRLGTAYKFNSTTNNRTGTVRVPSISQVQIGVVFDASDSLTGTYDGSDRWTDPGVANVRISTAYKANSTTNNRTGVLNLPIVSDVRLGVSYDNGSATGTLNLPSINDVRFGTTFDNATKTGNVTIPTTGQVKIGITYNSLLSSTGTYDGSDRWTDPGASNVLLGIAYKANSTSNNQTGTLESTDPGVGTVINGVTYKINSVSKTGTFTTPTSAAIASAVWDETLSSHTTSGTFGWLIKKLLTTAKFLGLK